MNKSIKEQIEYEIEYLQNAIKQIRKNFDKDFFELGRLSALEHMMCRLKQIK